MKRRDVEKILNENGWKLHTHGNKHDSFVNPDFPGVKGMLQRHRDIPEATAKQVLIEAGITKKTIK